VDLAQLAQTRSALENLQCRHTATLRRDARDLDARDQTTAVLRSLAGESAARRAQVRQRRERMAELESGRALGDLLSRLAHREARLGPLERDRALLAARDWQDLCEAAETRGRALQSDPAEQAAETRALEGLLLRAMESSCDTGLKGDRRHCPDLAGWRVQCVGGRHAQTSTFGP
jgi:hypothetical protein